MCFLKTCFFFSQKLDFFYNEQVSKQQVLNLDIFHDNNYVVFILKRIFSFEFFKVDEKDSSNDTLAYEDDAHKVNLCTFGHFFIFAKL